MASVDLVDPREVAQVDQVNGRPDDIGRTDPAALSTAARLCKTCSVSRSMPPETSSPVSGWRPICPDKNTRSPDTTA